MKRYSKYKDSGIAWLREIPEQWRIESFKNILKERNEKNNPIRTKEILSLSINKGVTLYAEKTTNLDRFKDDVSKYKLAHKGDLVLNSMNMIVGAVGVSKYFGCVSPVYYTFYGNNSDAYTTRFYEYLFRCKVVQSVLYSLGRGLIAIDRGEGKYNTLRLKISRDDLRSMRLPLPNISEQIALVNYLDFKTEKIDRFIKKKKQLIVLLNEQKAAIVNKAVTKGINPNVKLKPSGIEWLGDIPEHWETKRMKFLGDAIIGLTYSPSEMVDEGEGTLVLRSSNVQKGKLAYEDCVYVTTEIPEKKRTRVGDILICSRNGSIKLVGKNALIDEKASNESFGAFMTVVRSPYFEYLHYYFNSASFKAQSGMFFTSTINQLTTGVLNQIIVSIPKNIKEQNEIVSYIKEETSILDKTISTIEKEITLVEEYKTALIAEAVTGKIDVREFEIPNTEEPLAMVAEEAISYNKVD
ncbi:type I restriction enzyme, S subunit [Polaribacter sp. KT25b]|uniref:restriction endonuclease subunit S n=1 Tax=Polaribacter sp. KT25b TaxID=1855336 RepID=UPI00087BC7C9|nr:restriction endonuclease subunit S [Polaribacter sp. KT25b]SDR67083.1 type I restriction enzyme, S subunit [Polaribacter sp. KT25b]